MIPPAYLPRLSRLISGKLGLHFPENRWDDLANGMMKAAGRLGFSDNGEEFARWVLTKGISTADLDIIAEQLTIGETYFFREKTVLIAFREMILPELIRERENTTKSIRIWSAGCCSGEEPYTLAIILTESIPDLNHWKVSITATDINRRFLEKANDGRYTQWSFRDTPKEVIKTFFRQTGKEFELIPEIRNMVKFMSFNLAEEKFPSEKMDLHSFDVIFCRNVLMYFTPENALVAAGKFHDTLNEKGWLVTSQVELNDQLFSRFEKVKAGHAFIYRKTSIPVSGMKLHKKPGAKGTTVKSPPLSGKQSLSGSVPRRSQAIKTEKRDPVQVSPSADPFTLALEAADRGNLPDALGYVKEAIRLNVTNTEDYYLAGIILLEQGKTAEAERHFRKTLYLDPNHLLSHFQMTMIARRNGNIRLAVRHRDQVMRILKGYDDGTTVPGTRGMTAGHLKGLINPVTKTVSYG